MPRLLLAEMADAVVVVRRMQVLQAVVLITIAMNVFGFCFMAVLPAFGTLAFGASPVQIGMLSAAEPAGALLTGLVMASRRGVPLSAALMLGGGGFFLACLLLVALAPTLPLAVAVLMLGGIGTALFAALQTALPVTQAPPEARSRVLGLVTTCIGMGPAGQLAIGALADGLGPGRGDSHYGRRRAGDGGGDGLAHAAPLNGLRERERLLADDTNIAFSRVTRALASWAPVVLDAPRPQMRGIRPLSCHCRGTVIARARSAGRITLCPRLPRRSRRSTRGSMAAASCSRLRRRAPPSPAPSRSARLQDISNRRWLRPPDVLPCFAAAQEQIEAVARRKLAGRAAATGGLMNLFSDDFEEEEAPAE